MNLDVEFGIETTGNRVRAVRVVHPNLPDPVFDGLGVQVQVQLTQGVARQIEFPHVRAGARSRRRPLGDLIQIRHE
jgi:hypothetical protein